MWKSRAIYEKKRKKIKKRPNAYSTLLVWLKGVMTEKAPFNSSTMMCRDLNSRFSKRKKRKRLVIYRVFKEWVKVGNCFKMFRSGGGKKVWTLYITILLYYIKRDMHISWQKWCFYHILSKCFDQRRSFVLLVNRFLSVFPLLSFAGVPQPFKWHCPFFFFRIFNQYFISYFLYFILFSICICLDFLAYFMLLSSGVFFVCF